LIKKRLSDTGAFSRVNAISAFEACGIYPLNRDKITSDKLSTSIPLTRQSQTSISTPLQVCPEPARERATVQSHLTSSSAEKLTPRKAIESAILSHLKQITPPDKSAKRVHVRRTLAECLTSDEVRKRMREDEERKLTSANKKCKTASNNGSKKKTTVVSQPKEQRKTGNSRPLLVIRKPTWLTRQDNQDTVPAADVSDVQLDAATTPREFLCYTSLSLLIMRLIILTNFCTVLGYRYLTALKTVEQILTNGVFCISVTTLQPMNESGRHENEANISPPTVSDECAQAGEPKSSLPTKTFYKSRNIRKPSRYAN